MGIKSKELMPGKGIGKVRLVVKLKKSVFRAERKVGMLLSRTLHGGRIWQYEQFTLSVIDLGGSIRAAS